MRRHQYDCAATFNLILHASHQVNDTFVAIVTHYWQWATTMGNVINLFCHLSLRLAAIGKS
jgi:hypothetical protein